MRPIDSEASSLNHATANLGQPLRVNGGMGTRLLRPAIQGPIPKTLKEPRTSTHVAVLNASPKPSPHWRFARTSQAAMQAVARLDSPSPSRSNRTHASDVHAQAMTTPTTKAK